MICQHRGCCDSVHTRDWCERHYRYRLHTGRHGYRPGEEAREHVLKLRSLGWTYTQIAEAAGTSNWVPHKLVVEGVRRLLEEHRSAILAIPLKPVGSHRGVDATGTYRRIEGLQWLGWPMADLGRRLGLKPYTLTTLRSRGEPVSYRVALAVRELYDQLSHLPGPSKQTATKARRRGYAPPLAWDDDTIDDPAAVPQVGDDDRRTREETAEEVVHLHRLGLSDFEIASKLQISPQRVHTLRSESVSRRSAA